MHKKTILAYFFSLLVSCALGQAPKGLTMEQYEKAKTFTINDLDNDTYVKVENNTYVLDRYEAKKPYFITGDDGLRKRIDLYTLSTKADGNMLGTMIFYTNEKGKRYSAVLPSNFAPGNVWEKYFEDIHNIDREEKFFVMKLSYVLSREYSFQQYKSTLKGKEADRSEAGTYGNDICFPGDEEVAMAEGGKKLLSQIKPGDRVISLDPVTRKAAFVHVKKLVVHEAKNYAITQLTLVHASEVKESISTAVQLSLQQLEATPNHPVTTKTGIKNIGAVNIGEEVICLDKKTGKYEAFTVWDRNESAKGTQQVYNIEADAGSTFIINGVMVMQKQVAGSK